MTYGSPGPGLTPRDWRRAQPTREPHSQEEINALISQSTERGARALLTTAKDEVKLRSFKFEMPCYAVDVAIEIDDESELRALIDAAIGDAKLA